MEQKLEGEEREGNIHENGMKESKKQKNDMGAGNKEILKNDKHDKIWPISC